MLRFVSRFFHREKESFHFTAFSNRGLPLWSCRRLICPFCVILPGPHTLRISSREPILEHDGLRIRVKNIFTLELPTRRRGREEDTSTLQATILPSPNQGDFFADPPHRITTIPTMRHPNDFSIGRDPFPYVRFHVFKLCGIMARLQSVLADRENSAPLLRPRRRRSRKRMAGMPNREVSC